MKPEARKDALLVEELQDETLVYDTKRQKAFCLNRTTAAVWQKCDGNTSTEQISRRVCDELGIDRGKDPDAGLDLIELALNRLARARLLSESSCAGLQAPRYSRRELARRIVYMGGFVTLVPTIFAINATAAVAAATCVSVCNSFNVGRCCCRPRRICILASDNKYKCQGAKC
jgi:hypothetical protein